MVAGDDSSGAVRERLGVTIGAAGSVDDLEAQRVLAEVERRMFETPAAPVRLARYLLLKPLGSGGAGVVYDGYDPELARRVAIKVLRPDRRDSDAAARARVRFLREAQSIARLSHPNVIAVYDVGTYATADLDVALRRRLEGDGDAASNEDAVFIVMEVVDGADVRTWLDEKTRGWREILDVFIAAGRGLSAAHAAGVVHRDFKPGNVLVGSDGRVKVVDFGLALNYGAPPLPVSIVESATDERPMLQALREEEEPDSDSGGWTGDKLTRTGVVLGTPVYMAPEQHAGVPPDAKADQFSFCASLYRALYGRFPFTGNDVDELYRRKAAHRIRRPPDRTPVPPWLWKIVARGMAPNPDDRWPDVDALLHALVNDPGRRLRRVLRGSAVPIAAAAVFYIGYLLTRPGQVEVVVQSRGAPVPGVEVFVDDQPLHVDGERASGEVPAGLHRVRVRAPDHREAEAVVEVQRNGTHEVAIELEHEQGTFDLEVDPRGGSVLIDGVDFGSRLTSVPIDTGPHEIVVRHEGYEDARLSWTARAGKTQRGFVSLRKALMWSQPMAGTDPWSTWIGDATGDGRAELLYRRFAIMTAYDPWRGDDLWQFELWRNSILQVCDADGDGVDDVLTLEWDESHSMRAAVRSGRDVGHREPQMLWSATVGPDRGTPRTMPLGRMRCGRDAQDRPLVWIGGPWHDQLAGYDGATGALRVSARARGPILDVVLADDAAQVVVVTDATVEAFDRDGRRRWLADVPFVPSLAPAATQDWYDQLAIVRSRGIGWITSTPAPGGGRDDVLLTTGRLDAPALFALDGATGAVRWTRPVVRFEDLDRPDAALDVDADGARERLVTTADGIALLDGATGVPRWTHAVTAEISAVLLDLGTSAAVVVREGPEMRRIDAATGTVAAIAPDAAATSSPIAMDWEGDGDVDIVAGAAPADVVAWDADLRRLGAVPMPVGVTNVDGARDGNGDGFVDVLAEARGPAVLVGPKVRWRRRYHDAIRATPVVEDIDGDERLEVVVLAPDDAGRWTHSLDAETGARRDVTADAGADIVRRPALFRTDQGFELAFVGSGVLRRMRGHDLEVLATRRVGAAWAPPAMADVDGDGRAEVFQPLWDPRGELLALDGETLDERWRAPLPSGGFDAPLLVDLDGDGALDLVASALAGTVVRIDPRTGETLWSTATGGRLNYAPAVGDLDGDGVPELLVSPKVDTHDLVVLRADDGTEVGRWPGLGSRRSRAVVRDVDGDGWMDVFSATRTQGIVRLDADGQVRWHYGFVDEDDRQPSSSGPVTIADIDGDGEYEVLAGFEDGSVRVVAAGTGAPVWVFHTGGGDVEGRPVVADVDGDGMAEIFVAGHDRNVYCLRHAPARPARGR